MSNFSSGTAIYSGFMYKLNSKYSFTMSWELYYHDEKNSITVYMLEIDVSRNSLQKMLVS